MSTIMITDHNENIYNLIKKEPSKPVQKPVTKSSHMKHLLAKEKQQIKKFPNKTMGYAEVPLPKPTMFLKKFQGVPRPKIVVDYKEHCKDDRCHPCRRIQPVSQRKDKKPQEPVIGIIEKAQDPWEKYINLQGQHIEQLADSSDKKHLKEIECQQNITAHESSKKVPQITLEKKSHAHNFLQENYMFVKNLPPQQPKLCYVDTNKGTSHALKPSGLQLNYSLKKTFGKLPKYLTLQKEKQQKLEKDMEMEEDRKLPEGRYITQEERQTLLEGLQHNWAELQKQYLLLPIIIDTVPKKNRKLKLEKELKELEKDIKIIKEHPCIFVIDADVPESTHEAENKNHT